MNDFEQITALRQQQNAPAPEEGAEVQNAEPQTDEVIAEPKIEAQEPAEGAAPAEEGEDNTENAKPSEQLLAALKKKYEAKGFKDDEDFYRQMMADYDSEHEWAKSQQAANADIAEKLKSRPEVAAFLIDLMNGVSPKQAALNLPDGFWDLEDGDEGWDEYQKAVAERKAQSERDAKAIADYEANLKASEDVVAEYAKKTGMTAEQIDALIGDYDKNVIEPLQQGKLTMELLDLIAKGRGYDEDIQKAEEAGRVAGRNEKIVERQRQIGEENGSGLPDAHGGSSMNNSQQSERERQAEMFEKMLRRS